MSILEKSIGRLMNLSPFFGGLVLKLNPMYDPGCGTAYTDGIKIGVDPNFFNPLTKSEQAFILAHEVMHVAMGHCTRRGSRDPKTWNMACDYAINHLLGEQGFMMPKGGLRDPFYSGWSAEKIYQHLQDQDSQDQDSQDQDSQVGEVRDYPGEDHKEHEESWAISVQSAINLESHIPQSQRVNERILGAFNFAPTVDWRDTLRDSLHPCFGFGDCIWTRPSRRGISSNMYLPARQSETIKSLVVAIDTSGSIDNEALKAFEIELNELTELYSDVSITIIYCSNYIVGIEEDIQGDIKLSPCGAGGTDFRPVFDWVENQDMNPQALLYFTDLLGPFPDAEPNYPVIFLDFSGYADKAPFGDLVTINNF